VRRLWRARLAARAHATLPDMRAKDCSSLIWALATVRTPAPRPELLDALMARAEQIAAAACPHTVSNMLWAMAVLGLKQHTARAPPLRRIQRRWL